MAEHCCSSLLFCCSSSIRERNSLHLRGCKESNPRWLLSLIQSDPHQWFVAATQATIFPLHMLLCLEALGWCCGGWRILWGSDSRSVGGGAVVHLAMMGINETWMGNEITKLYQRKGRKEDYQVHTVTTSLSAEQSRGRTCTCSSTHYCNAGADGTRGSCAISFVVSGTPATPTGIRFMARKDVCQAVSLSPVGLHWKDKCSLKGKNNIVADYHLPIKII